MSITKQQSNQNVYPKCKSYNKAMCCEPPPNPLEKFGSRILREELMGCVLASWYPCIISNNSSTQWQQKKISDLSCT